MLTVVVRTFQIFKQDEDKLHLGFFNLATAIISSVRRIGSFSACQSGSKNLFELYGKKVIEQKKRIVFH